MFGSLCDLPLVLVYLIAPVKNTRWFIVDKRKGTSTPLATLVFVDRWWVAQRPPAPFG